MYTVKRAFQSEESIEFMVSLKRNGANLLWPGAFVDTIDVSRREDSERTKGCLLVGWSVARHRHNKGRRARI
jgi:hypothetical protein